MDRVLRLALFSQILPHSPVYLPLLFFCRLFFRIISFAHAFTELDSLASPLTWKRKPLEGYPMGLPHSFVRFAYSARSFLRIQANQKRYWPIACPEHHDACCHSMVVG
jgi:hypothetical protein